jgi:hypothetical protein
VARMPGAEWSPLGPQTEPRITPTVVCLHSMAGSFSGTDAWFRKFNGAGYQGTESHFGVAFDGRVRQWQDTGRQADANGPDGGGYVLSIETEDDGTPDNTPWTPAQFEAIARILAWAYAEHGVPLVDTKGVPDARGVAIHRYGVNPWRKPGHDRWSTSAGKTCPGEARIRQVPAVIARARILAGLDRPADSSKPPAPATSGDRPMYLISCPARGVAVIGDDYWMPLPNDEHVHAALALLPAENVKATDNPRLFDLWVAIATQGKTSSDAVEAAMAEVPSETAQLVVDELRSRLTA